MDKYVGGLYVHVDVALGVHVAEPAGDVAQKRPKRPFIRADVAIPLDVILQADSRTELHLDVELVALLPGVVIPGVVTGQATKNPAVRE